MSNYCQSKSFHFWPVFDQLFYQHLGNIINNKVNLLNFLDLTYPSVKKTKHFRTIIFTWAANIHSNILHEKNQRFEQSFVIQRAGFAWMCTHFQIYWLEFIKFRLLKKIVILLKLNGSCLCLIHVVTFRYRIFGKHNFDTNINPKLRIPIPMLIDKNLFSFKTVLRNPTFLFTECVSKHCTLQ